MGCNKEKFDKRTATTILNKCKREHRPECRIYECDKCIGWWHLTSSEEYEEIVQLREDDLVYKEKWMKLKES